MRRLILLRHAKAVSSPGQPDRNRALSARGRAQAPIAGAFLARQKLIPDVTIVSAANRTRETWDLVSPHLRGAPKAVFDHRLYLAEPEDIAAIVAEVPESVSTILLVGHNPGLHELAASLATSGDDAALAALHDGFPTSAIAVLRFDADAWDDLARARGRLEHFVSPATLGAEAD